MTILDEELAQLIDDFVKADSTSLPEVWWPLYEGSIGRLIKAAEDLPPDQYIAAHAEISALDAAWRMIAAKLATVEPTQDQCRVSLRSVVRRAIRSADTISAGAQKPAMADALD
jgi:hypothetical protein